MAQTMRGMTMDCSNKKARCIAFYLPQFHPIPENDEWWGKGFTEWANVAKAKPMFRGHYQPHIPADLGFYDLRVPETRVAQASLAEAHGVEAFCYWHYWFAGRRILERPFDEVLKLGEPQFPFCLGWANQSWSGIWHGNPQKILIEQTYPGQKDHEAHFYHLLKAFADERYLTVDGKPLVYIFQPQEIPNVKRFTDFWRELSFKAGLKGLYLVANGPSFKWVPGEYGFDASAVMWLPPRLGWQPWRRQPISRIRGELNRSLGRPTVYRYCDVNEKFVCPRFPNIQHHPCLVPNFDNSPRCGINGLVLHDSTPAQFRIQVWLALDRVSEQPFEQRLIFIKSWNEWAEGNYLEPDLKYGLEYLNVLKQEVTRGGWHLTPLG